MNGTAHWRVDQALRSWGDTRAHQATRSREGGRAQEGNRAAVTGGQHLDGIGQLVVDEVASIGAPGLTFLAGRKATLPGFYRPAKSWDLLVLQDAQPVLAVEFKSMKGSVSNNLNNRADEVFGVAEDLRQAELKGIVPKTIRRAYVFVLSLDKESTAVPQPVSVAAGKTDEIFDGASYLERAAIMCERMQQVGLYHLAWLVGVQEQPFKWEEPRKSVSWVSFSKGLHDMFKDGVVRPLPQSDV